MNLQLNLQGQNYKNSRSLIKDQFLFSKPVKVLNSDAPDSGHRRPDTSVARWRPHTPTRIPTPRPTEPATTRCDLQAQAPAAAHTVPTKRPRPTARRPATADRRSVLIT